MITWLLCFAIELVPTTLTWGLRCWTRVQHWVSSDLGFLHLFSWGFHRVGWVHPQAPQSSSNRHSVSGTPPSIGRPQQWRPSTIGSTCWVGSQDWNIKYLWLLLDSVLLFLVLGLPLETLSLQLIELILPIHVVILQLDDLSLEVLEIIFQCWFLLLVVILQIFKVLWCQSGQLIPQVVHLLLSGCFLLGVSLFPHLDFLV